MSLYEDFIKENEVPVIFADFSGIITSINKRFEETFLWPAEKLVGRPLSAIIPKNLHDSHNMGFSKYIIGCPPSILNTPLELQIRLGNGDIISAEHFIVDFRHDGMELIAAKIIPR
jgi:PAS domain-containing protein